MKQLNPIKFWPAVILLFGTIGYSFIDPDAFLHYAQAANDWVLTYFSWLFSWSVLLFLLLLVIIYLSPFGKLKIGGPAATPLLSPWRWFSITLCTTIATGILFWGTAEPLFHFREPPSSLGIQPGSDAARIFSMSTMFLHWTLSPYAIYTMAALLFAWCFYNLGQPFSVSATLYPLFGRISDKPMGHLTDTICLFGLIAGMSASLGAGILTISGGLDQLLGISYSLPGVILIALLIVITFTMSAASGLLKGITWLSDFNTKGFVLLAMLFLITGPTGFLISNGAESSLAYITHFFPRSINWGNQLNTSWFESWTIFNWANWLAWAPITALFLGRLGRGYTVRTFIHMNLLWPALFGGVWMAIFSGMAIHADTLAKAGLFQEMQTAGAETVIYHLIGNLEYPKLIGAFFLLLTFLSYVTAADSNTSAMSNLCSYEIDNNHQESSTWIKALWGTIVGALACIMLSGSGMNGIKMISVLGGFPALFLMIAMGFGWIKLLLQHGHESSNRS